LISCRQIRIITEKFLRLITPYVPLGLVHTFALKNPLRQTGARQVPATNNDPPTHRHSACRSPNWTGRRFHLINQGVLTWFSALGGWKAAIFSVPRIVLLFILGGIAILSSHGAPREIIGTLRSDSGENLPDVGVQLYTWYPFFDTSSFTDSNGVFRFSVTPGQYFLDISSANLLSRGYRAIPLLYIDVEFQSVLTQLVVHPIGPTNHLRGKVVDRLGNPLTNWNVVAVTSNGVPSLQSITDTRGAFDLALFFGPWNVTVHQPFQVNGSWYFPQRTVQMIEGLDQEIRLTAFAPTASISGTARGSDGKTFDYVNIHATTEFQESKYETTTSASPDGSFFIPVFDAAWALSATVFECCTGYGTFSNTVVAVHGTNEIVQLVCQAPAQFAKGSVVDDHGNPIQGATISASKFGPPDFSRFTAISDTHGNFAVPISAGKWRLSMYLPGWVPPEGQTFYVAPDEQKTGLTFRAIRSTGIIEVEFIHGEGMRPDVSVHASSTINGQTFQLSSGLDYMGRATLEAFDGTWIIHPELYSSLAEPPQYVQPSDQTVTIMGNTQHVVVALEPYDYPANKTHLRGRLLTPDGHPFPSIEVFADNGFTTPSVLSSADGSFDLEVWEGIWDLFANETQLRPLNLLSASPSCFVTNGVDIDGIELTTAVINGALRGTVVDEDGKPIAGISFTAKNWTTNSVYGCTVVSDENGAFSFDAFEGEWSVREFYANGEGYQSVPEKIVQVTNGLGSVTFTLQPLSPKYWVPQLSLPAITNGALQLTLNSEVWERYRIEASPDLSHWTPVTTNFAWNGGFNFTDLGITNAVQRFYRALLQPW
jgi:uncharacterized GH25 family protein